MAASQRYESNGRPQGRLHSYGKLAKTRLQQGHKLEASHNQIRNKLETNYKNTNWFTFAIGHINPTAGRPAVNIATAGRRSNGQPQMNFNTSWANMLRHFHVCMYVCM